MSEPVIDDEVKEEIENTNNEQLFAEYGTGNTDSNEEFELAKGWFPDSEDWSGKTDITMEQARAMALVQNLDTIFPELEEVSEFLSNAIDNYKVLLTSVEGRSRQEQMAVLKAMYGQDADIEEKASMFGAMMGVNSEADNDD